MIPFGAAYGELAWTDAKYKVKPREDLLKLLDTRPASILELGCADGTNLLYFAQQLRAAGANVQRLVGVDSHALRDCPNYGAFEFVHSTAEAFVEQRRDVFDLILLSDVVEHLFNPWKTLASLRDRLSDDGRILVSVPNLQNLNYVFRVASGEFRYEASGLMDVTHIRFFSRQTLAALLDDCGFAVCRTGYRPDASLGPAVEEWRRRISSGQSAAAAHGSCSVVVDERNIEVLSAQQLLACARKKAA